MELISSIQASEMGPSRLPDIELVCKLMTNTRRFSSDIQKVLRLI
jgi:hypothetical protein